MVVTEGAGRDNLEPARSFEKFQIDLIGRLDQKCIGFFGAPQ